ncbi:MAG: oxidoreductase [Gorillibacterium sp.]|nr:oxidoreductase [Gorillibacterium sp.]
MAEIIEFPKAQTTVEPNTDGHVSKATVRTDASEHISKTAVLLGASGLVGSSLLKLLLQDNSYIQVTVIVRRPLSFTHDNLNVIVEADFDRLQEYSAVFAADDIFCCLGTTIGEAGSQAAFSRVDLDYPATAARLASQAGARSFHAISSLGANAKSRAFYPRVKGLMEASVASCGLPRVSIYRPSLLLGERTNIRFGEKVATKIFQMLPFLFSGPLARYRPIPGETVAKAMLADALYSSGNPVGEHATGRQPMIHAAEKLFELAKQYDLNRSL